MFLGILKSSNAIGIYQEQTNLIISKNQYLKSSKLLLDNYLPIDLWVYIGLQKRTDGNNAYTYGMYLFGKIEFEILSSRFSLQEIYNNLYDVCSFSIKEDINFKNGDTFGFTNNQKIKVTSSDGFNLPFTTLKLSL